MLEQELLMQMPKKRKRVFHTLDAFGEYQTCAYIKDIKLDFSKSPLFSNNNLLDDKKFKPNNIPNYSRQFNQFDNYGNNSSEGYYEIPKPSEFKPITPINTRFDFKESGFQFHTHNTKEGFFGNIQTYGKEKEELNEYQTAMGSFYANNLRIKKTKW